MLDTVSVPEQFEPIFQKAEDYVSAYFSEKKQEVSKGKIEIFGQRYILVRAASMSVDFFDTIKNMFKDFGDEKASEIARSLLFDVAHAIGMMDARNFHQKMGVKEPIEKLSAGPIHFSHTGWAFVDIFAESRPTPDENYYLIYDHLFSFEADAWEDSGKNSNFCVCAMNAGYSSGWCEESFGIPLVASEIMCRAKGDSTCRFIMAHPSKIRQYLQEYLRVHPDISDNVTLYRIGGFFQERKQAEDALRKSEDRFKQVAENAGEWIWEVNAEGLYTYSSPIAEEILGYTTEEIVGKKHFYDFFAPDVKDELKKAAFEVFAKRESFRGFINPNIHKNGSTVILETNGTPIIDDRGNLCGYRGADRDITERKKAEERISHLNHLKEELLAPISIDEKLKHITDALVKILDADFARIWMIKSGDLCNSGCIHADVKDGPHDCRHRDRCLHLMASSGRYTHIDGQVHRRVPFGCYKIGRVAAGTDTKFITNDVTHEQRVHNKEWAKKLGLVSFAGYRLISTEGVPVGVMALFSKHIVSANDDTMLETIANTASQVIQTTTAGEELRKTEEKYRVQFEGALDAIFVADAETGILIDCNPAGTRLVGREKSELIGQSHKILHPPKENDEEFAETFKQHLNEKRGQTLETQVITKTGEIKEVAIKANLLEIGGKKVLQGVFRDITKRKRDQEELERTNEELKKASRTAGMAEVATDVLHNVGNVLNSINVSVSFIEERVLDSKVANLKKVVDMIAEHANDLGTFLTEDQRGKHIPVYLTEATKLIDDEQAHITEKLQSLIKNVEHIKQIIQAQQRYARAGGVEVLTSINDIIKDAIEINSAGLKRHGVEFKLELSELPEFHMDKQRILQILVNLISNAKSALSKSEKQVRLLTIRSYRHAEGRLRIEVADNGKGISKENMAKIFIHGFTTRREGHGFGLHSSALAAKEMGGSLTVHSDGPGNGATFTLELPIKSVEVTECKR